MISIVIPAYNEETSISKCLEALTRQETVEEFEVIVVDNASTDNTVAIAKRFADRLTLRIIPETRKGRGRARATGWAATKGDIILSTDADTVVPPQWVQTYADAFDRYPEIVGMTGNSTIHDCAFLINFLQNTTQPIVGRFLRSCIGFYCLNGYNSGVRRWAYLASGGFDPTLDAQDDMDLSIRLQHFGPMNYSTKTCVQMSGRRFKRGLIKGAFDYPRTYVMKFWFKKDWVPLEDVR